MSKVTSLQNADAIIDGSQAKALDSLCKAYEVAKEQYTFAKNDKDNITSDIKNLLKNDEGENVAGRYVTSNYNVLITVTDKSLTVDLKKLAEIEPDVFENLIAKYPKVSNGSVTLKSVTKRGEV